MHVRLITIFLLALLVFPGLVWAWTGKVVRISDGDTVTVLRDGHEQVKVRLYGVDSPESGQDFGQRAKQFTSAALGMKMAEVEVLDVDRYGRSVGLVTAAGQAKSINEKLVEAGMAWVYRKYCRKTFCNEWIADEALARSNKVGLWAQPAVAPWDWRRGERATSQVQVDADGEYHGNVESDVLHRRGCRYFNCRDCTAVFSSKQKAVSKGYRPCKICKP